MRTYMTLFCNNYYTGQTPVNVESAPEKRKHEELSESESDSSVLDLDNLEGYISEDDPDYEASCSDTFID